MEKAVNYRRLGKKAAESGVVEMILLHANSAFDMHPAADNLDTYFDLENYQAELGGIAPQRAELFSHF